MPARSPACLRCAERQRGAAVVLALLTVTFAAMLAAAALADFGRGLEAAAAVAAGAGVLGGLLAGGAIGRVLIEVVNRQSFHWSMDLHVPWGSLLLFAGGLTALAALAAVLAGRQAMRQGAVLAVREDW